MIVSIITPDDEQNVSITTTDERQIFKIDPVSTETAKAIQASADKVSSEDITDIVKLTQAEYDALTPDENTLYLIT